MSTNSIHHYHEYDKENPQLHLSKPYTMPIQNIALIGASGTLGPAILSALRAHPTFIPFVLNRHSSKSIYPKTRVITVPDDLNPSEVAQLLRQNSIDALVIAIAGSYVDEQKKLIDAAFEAGVKRVMPAEFGSCDSADEETVKLLPLMEGKRRVREYLQAVCRREREGGRLTWTSLVTGHFFDWGLGNGLIKFDVKNRKAYMVDGGDVKFSASSLGLVAKAVVRVLEKEEETKDRMLYVHGVYVTQREVLPVLEKVTGTQWEVVDEDSKKRLDVIRPKMLEGDHDAREEVVAIWGVVASDWAEKEGFANDLLGLEMEDLEEVVRRGLKGEQ
jgi:nucleoside-diphosphate-sugar epimerase